LKLLAIFLEIILLHEITTESWRLSFADICNWAFSSVVTRNCLVKQANGLADEVYLRMLACCGETAETSDLKGQEYVFFK